MNEFTYEHRLAVDPSFTCPTRIDRTHSKWRFNGDLMIRGEFPLQIDLELVPHCNFRCPNCPQSFMNVKPKLMDIKLIRRLLIEGALSDDFESIKLQYRGEPLLYPNIGGVIEFAKSLGIYVHFNTNGFLLSDELINCFIDCNLDKIIFSVDSSNPSLYNEMRKGGRFGKVFSNIVQLAFEKLKRNSEYPRVRVQAVLTDDNKEEIKSGEYKEMFELFAEEIGHEDYFNFKDPIDTSKIELPNWHCGQLWQRLVVLVDGKVIPCCGGIDYARDKIYEVGDANITPIHTIWTSRKMDEMRKLHSEGKSHLVEMCARCRVRKYVIDKLEKLKEENNGL